MPLGRLRELEEGVKPCNVGVRSAITAWHAVGKQRSNAITLLSISSLCRSGRPSLAPSLPCTTQASVNYSGSLLCEVLLRHSARLQHLLHDVQKPCATSIRKIKKHSRTNSDVWCVSCASCPYVTQGQDLYRIEHKLDVSIGRKNVSVFIHMYTVFKHM